MNTFQSVALAGLVVLVGIGSACRKRRPVETSPSAAPETAASPTPVPSSGQAPVKSSVPALSAKDEAEIRKRYVPAAVPWSQRTPDQKQMAYLGWCQIYMLGDAATKAKVVAEIKQAGLSAEDLEALKKKNRDMRIPLMPL